jgi:uncharacterized protein (TIGR02246 family)
MSDHSADEEAIRQSFEAATDAIKRGDAKAYAAHYTPDADRIDGFGRVSKGPVNIEQAVQELLTGPLHGATIEGEIENIRFLAPTIAIVDTIAHATPTQGPPFKARGVSVLVKQNGQWLSTAFRIWTQATVVV